MHSNFNPRNRLHLNKYHQTKAPLSASKLARKRKRDL